MISPWNCREGREGGRKGGALIELEKEVADWDRQVDIGTSNGVLIAYNSFLL
jgi:hypothetical protein